MDNNPFINVKLFPNFSTGHTIQWYLDPVFRGAEPYHFTLEVAETPTFTSLINSIDADNKFFAVDNSHIKQGFSKSYIYRVKLVDDNGKTYYSRNLNLFSNDEEARKYLMAAEITRKEFVRMRFVGREGWIIKRKGYGEINLLAVDPVSGVPLTDTNEDFGTGVIDGYYPPLRIKFSQESEDRDVTLNPQGFGVTDDEILTIRTVGFPYFDVKDIIVNNNDERFLVWKIVDRVFPGTNITLVQSASIRRIPPSDTIYNIKII